MVDGENAPLLFRLILFFVRKNVEDGILPYFFGVQTAKVVIHEGFNCLMNVINYALQFVVFVGVNLWERGRKANLSLFDTFTSQSLSLAHLMTEDYALLNKRLGQKHGMLLVNKRVSSSMNEKIILR